MINLLGDEVINKIQKIILHEKYDKVTKDHDVALLKLEKSVKYSKLIRPICLPFNDKNYKPGAKCVVAGWGYDKEWRGSLPNLLHAVEVVFRCFSVINIPLSFALNSRLTCYKG